MPGDLYSRLRRALASGGPETPRERVVARPANEGAIERLVPGMVQENAAGRYFRAISPFASDHVHGRAPLLDFTRLTRRGFACLARQPELEDVDPSRIVFLDTETTGLAGGTGTYVFMVGLAYLDRERLVVDQFFMRDHSEERAMLEALADTLSGFEHVATFNGKSFDLPLLATRYTAARLRPRLDFRIHFDLLFPSRRVWRDRLESCSLGTIELDIFGHRRARDLPSWQIPEAYFRYVRQGDADDVALVFEHNVHDLLSLVTLTGLLGRLFERGEENLNGHDLYAVARLYEDLGWPGDAADAYRRVLDHPRERAVRESASLRLAHLLKRTGRYEEAAVMWKDLIRQRSSGWTPYVELAKVYEHRLRDLPRALAVVEHALTRMEVSGVGDGTSREDLEYRLARLRRKQAARGAAAVAEA
ncbi:MAG: ribonuclease H-like domain-containing protein [Chloroflexota bacterium]